MEQESKSKPFNGAYKNQKVLVTGHTGFKGSWLSQWLLSLGAKVYGYALAPNTTPSLFEQLKLEDHIEQQIDDIRNLDALKSYIKLVKPEVIFHLAAQSLVRYSYKEPLETVQVNTLGTANLLEAVRQLNIPAAIVAITTDKCYENREWIYGYREEDPLGGFDPYSSSKGAAELIISSWRNSFFPPEIIDRHGVRLSSARAGNVVGGGDWSDDRIVPDCIRALSKHQSIQVRNPNATRPWQHVLEPLGGYLTLGERLLVGDSKISSQYCGAYNFGPLISNNRSVREVVNSVVENWGEGDWIDKSDQNAPHEASLLHLTIDKAYHHLNWLPKWDFSRTFIETVNWYKNSFEHQSTVFDFTMDQVKNYQRPNH